MRELNLKIPMSEGYVNMSDFYKLRDSLKKETGLRVTNEKLFSTSVFLLFESKPGRLTECLERLEDFKDGEVFYTEDLWLRNINKTVYENFYLVKELLGYSQNQELTDSDIFILFVDNLLNENMNKVIGSMMRNIKFYQNELPCQTYAHMPIQNKIYISGPMTGIPGFNHPAFIKTKRRLNLAGYQVFSPHESPDCGAWENYMRHDLAGLLKCGNIYMLDGWENSRGAAIERNLAKELGLLSCRFESGKVVFERMEGC